MTTCRPTPICGAAMPAPFFERMVSSMSCKSACNSGVSNCVTGAERANNNVSPILKTGLIIAFHPLLEQYADLDHRALQYRVDLFQVYRLAAVAPPRSVIDHHGDRGIAQSYFSRQPRFRHAGHADHVGTVTLQPVDFGGALQTRALGGRVGAAHHDRLADGGRGFAHPLAQPVAIGMREIDMRYRLIGTLEKGVLAAPRVVEQLMRNRECAGREVGTDP